MQSGVLSLNSTDQTAKRETRLKTACAHFGPAHILPGVTLHTFCLAPWPCTLFTWSHICFYFFLWARVFNLFPPQLTLDFFSVRIPDACAFIPGTSEDQTRYRNSWATRYQGPQLMKAASAVDFRHFIHRSRGRWIKSKAATAGELSGALLSCAAVMNFHPPL